MISHLPRPTPNVVARPRLTTLLDAGTPLTLLRAPTGFGKTTLVAQWLRQRGGDTELVAWARARPGAGDAATVWADVVDALADAGLPMRRTDQHVPHLLATQAERAIAAAEVPVVLVVDNVENLADGMDDSLLELVRYAAPLRLIVCGRSHSHFRSHQYVDLETTTISARDLLFTLEETRELLTAVNLRLPESNIKTIQDVSGGWPAPTRALALSLPHSLHTPGELIEIVDGIAIDYLRRHVLPAATRPDRVELALATALPEEFTAALATVLSGDPEANAHLELLAVDGMLLGRQRGGEYVYRWPAAARTALLNELTRRDPAQVPLLYSRLASWYLQNDDPARALQYAVRATDWQLAIRVIESSYRTLVSADHDAQLYEALLAIPVDVLITSPLAIAARAVHLPVPDEALRAAASLPESPAELARIGRSDGVAQVLETGFAVLGALLHRGRLDRAFAYADQLLQITAAARGARPGAIRTIYPSVQLLAGTTRMAGGDLAGALPCLWEAYDRAADDPHANVARDAAGKAALLHAVAGDIPGATRALRLHDEAPFQDSHPEPTVRTSSAAAARLLIALDRLDLAAAAAAHAELSGPRDGGRDALWAFHVYAQAQWALHTGTVADALDQLAAARTTLGHRLEHGAAAGPLLAAAELDLRLAHGQANHARAVLTGAHGRHPLLQVGRARLALISGDNAAALRLSGDSSWSRHTLARHRLEMLLIRAVAARRNGECRVAQDALNRTAGSVRRDGSVRVFTTVPRLELLELAAHVPAAADVIDDAILRDTNDVFPAQLTLVQLTAREQLVLQKLGDGLTTRQIADALVVSVNTIKTQLRSLYGKLGTASRHEAIALGRQWGLFPEAVSRTH